MYFDSHDGEEILMGLDENDHIQSKVIFLARVLAQLFKNDGNLKTNEEECFPIIAEAEKYTAFPSMT